MPIDRRGLREIEFAFCQLHQGEEYGTFVVRRPLVEAPASTPPTPGEVGLGGDCRMIQERNRAAERNRRARSQVSGDRPACRLIAAILNRAFADLRLGGTVAADALRWLESGGTEQPWSFAWCCNELGLNPRAVCQLMREDVVERMVLLHQYDNVLDGHACARRVAAAEGLLDRDANGGGARLPSSLKKTYREEPTHCQG